MKIFKIEKKILAELAGNEKSSFYKFLSLAQTEHLNIAPKVQQIISAVKKNGDEALIRYCNQFDKTSFKKAQDFVVSKKEILEAEKKVSDEVKSALKIAYKRIEAYHQKQVPQDFSFTDNAQVKLGNCWRAIDSVGIYVPGGTASYPSSVLMSTVPALVAGVKEISICAPSNANEINSAVLFASKICGVEKIYKVGGAQAIAAFTYGTKTIKKVNKIFGPGNSFVACAKKLLFGEVGIDMIAGPTDLTIVADNTNNPTWIAADTLSQLEHGPDSKSFIVTNDGTFAKKIVSEIDRLKSKLPRQSIIEKSLKNSAIFVIKNLDEADHLVNFIAPEHLEIMSTNHQKLLPKIKNAGAIFLGKYTPEAIGDYIAGPSHTLPTSASAKFSSGLSVFDFLKRISLISCNQKSFFNLASQASVLANCEGLHAHQLSIEIRNK